MLSIELQSAREMVSFPSKNGSTTVVATWTDDWESGPQVSSPLDSKKEEDTWKDTGCVHSTTRTHILYVYVCTCTNLHNSNIWPHTPSQHTHNIHNHNAQEHTHSQTRKKYDDAQQESGTQPHSHGGGLLGGDTHQGFIYKEFAVSEGILSWVTARGGTYT